MEAFAYRLKCSPMASKASVRKMRRSAHDGATRGFGIYPYFGCLHHFTLNSQFWNSPWGTGSNSRTLLFILDSLLRCGVASLLLSAPDELFLHPRRLAYVQGEPSHYRSPEPDRAGVGPDASRRRARGCRRAQTSANRSGRRGTSRMGIVACRKRSFGVSRCARGLAQ